MPDPDRPPIDPALRERVLEEEEAAGRIVRVPGGQDTEQEARQGLSDLLKVKSKEKPVTAVPQAVRGILGFADELLGLHGPGEVKPKGTFQPQREGLADAAETLVEGKKEKKAEFHNVSINLEETERLAEEVKAQQKYEKVLEEHREKVQNHVWTKEVRLHKILSGAWVIAGPVFETKRGLREWGMKLYGYMTERGKKAAETREANEALLKEWETKKGREVEAKAEAKGREKLADELAKAFVRKLEEEEKPEAPATPADRRDRGR
jgi:hypothetical protein